MGKKKAHESFLSIITLSGSYLLYDNNIYLTHLPGYVKVDPVPTPRQSPLQQSAGGVGLASV